jgi:hypothetical protein
MLTVNVLSSQLVQTLQHSAQQYLAAAALPPVDQLPLPLLQLPLDLCMGYCTSVFEEEGGRARRTYLLTAPQLARVSRQPIAQAASAKIVRAPIA